VVVPKKEYSVYKKGLNPGGNVYSWNSHAVKDMPVVDICSFYVEDWRFISLMKTTKKATHLLSKFKYVIQPDYSVYYDVPLVDQIFRCYTGKRIGDIWTQNGMKIIPNLVLGSKDLLPYATYGIENGSSFAVQIQANSQDSEQDGVDEWTIKSALDIIQPETFLVYGAKDGVSLLHLDDTPNMIVINTLISTLRTLNVKVK
jgi:hypothetical protein